MVQRFSVVHTSELQSLHYCLRYITYNEDILSFIYFIPKLQNNLACPKLFQIYPNFERGQYYIE